MAHGYILKDGKKEQDSDRYDDGWTGHMQDNAENDCRDRHENGDVQDDMIDPVLQIIEGIP